MLQKIRKSMGSPDFVRQVFDKVFNDDIVRLRSMEDMWKNRKTPIPLNFDEMSKNADSIDTNISDRGQMPWTVGENFVVFCDRSVDLRHLRIRDGW